MVDSPFAIPFFQLAPARPAIEVHAPAMERGAICEACPLFGCNQGPILGEIRRNAKLTIVGEAPGEKELLAKRPFVGWSGQILDSALSEGGLNRNDCSVTNTILCKPPGDGNYKALTDLLMQNYRRKVRVAEKQGRDPPPLPVLPQEACAPRLARDIAESNAKVVLAVGKQALEAVARDMQLPYGSTRVQAGEIKVASIAKQHGAPVLHPDGRILMSSYHPAMAAPGRGRSEYLRPIRENLMRGAWVAAHDGFIPWHEPKIEVNPTVDQALSFLARLRAVNAETTIDIETDSIDPYTAMIRCIGVGAYLGPEGREEAIMSIPIRHMDGSRWFDEESTRRIAYALRAVLDENPLNMQNGAFDTSVLLARGVMTNRMKSWTDTMLLHKNTPDNDLPHDLGFIIRRFFCAPMHKADVDHKSVDNINDSTLALYNGKDIAGTMRVVAPLREEMATWNTWPQYGTDYQLAPVVREMGDLGLVIDEAKRGEFSEVLNWQAQRELYKFRELIGKPKFNPRSVPQLQELIFQEWDYLPVIGTDGYEIKWPEAGAEDWRQQVLAEADFEEADALGEVGSTSSSALIEIMKKREQKAPHHWESLKTLLEYRAYDKLRGTYVDSMRVRAVDWPNLGVEVPWLPAARAITWDKDRECYADTELIGPRQALSLLNTIYKLHVTPCVVGDTWLLSDTGPRQISTLDDWGPAGTEHTPVKPLQLHNGGNFNSVAVLVNPGVRSTRRLRTVLGCELTATNNHRVVVSRRGQKFSRLVYDPATKKQTTELIKPIPEWRRMDALAVGDYVCVPIGMNAWSMRIPELKIRSIDLQARTNFKTTIKIPTEVTPALAYFAGVYQADGSLHDSSGSFSIRISNDDPKVQRPVAAAARALFGEEAVHTYPTHVEIRSKALETWTVDVGFGRRIENKRAPSWVLQLPKPLMLQYVRGCMIDSHTAVIGETTPVWKYTGTRQLAHEMQLFLLNLGIPAGLHDVSEPGHEKRWQCVVTGAIEVADVCALSGQTPPAPARQGDRRRPKYIRRGNKLWLRILSVEDAGDQQVYDVAIPDVHCFWSNGFISHNTGRLATSPNVQNWPALGKANMRDMVVAPPGHVLVLGDYAQLEARLYAVVANDELLLRAIREGKDIHSMNAAALLAKTHAEIDYWYDKVEKGDKKYRKYWRTIAKRFAFLEIYGGEDDKLFSVMAQQRDKETGDLAFPNLERGMVDTWHENWHNLHPWTRLWHYRTHQKCEATGYASVCAIDFRKRFFLGGVSKKNAVPNLEIQGWAASIANRALLRLVEAIPFRSWSYWTGVNLQVHDALGVMVPKDREEQAMKILGDCMYYEYSGVPFPAEVTTARRWSKLD